MAYDEGLAARLHELLDGRPRVTEKAMFGGIAYLFDGKMFVGIVKDELMVRVGPDAHDDAIAEPFARTMDFTGRPMRGYVFVAPQGFEDDDVLARWVDRAMKHVATLPDKKPTAKKAKPAAKASKPAVKKPAVKKPAVKKPAADKPRRR